MILVWCLTYWVNLHWQQESKVALEVGVPTPTTHFSVETSDFAWPFSHSHDPLSPLDLCPRRSWSRQIQVPRYFAHSLWNCAVHNLHAVGELPPALRPLRHSLVDLVVWNQRWNFDILSLSVAVSIKCRRERRPRSHRADSHLKGAWDMTSASPVVSPLQSSPQRFTGQ